MEESGGEWRRVEQSGAEWRRVEESGAEWSIKRLQARAGTAEALCLLQGSLYDLVQTASLSVAVSCYRWGPTLTFTIWSVMVPSGLLAHSFCSQLV